LKNLFAVRIPIHLSLVAAGSLLMGACAIPGEEKKDAAEAAATSTSAESTAVQTPSDPAAGASEESDLADLPPSPIEDLGLRLPPMLNLPGEREFRASNPAVPRPGDGGAVISRPPTDPPPRPRPQEGSGDEEKPGE
jgi:hypothetical protein